MIWGLLRLLWGSDVPAGYRLTDEPGGKYRMTDVDGGQYRLTDYEES